MCAYQSRVFFYTNFLVFVLTIVLLTYPCISVQAQNVVVAEGDIVDTEMKISANTPGEYTWELIKDGPMQLFIGKNESFLPSLRESYPEAWTIISPVWRSLIGHSPGEKIFLEIPYDESPYYETPDAPLYGKNLQYDLKIISIEFDAIYEPTDITWIFRPEVFIFLFIVVVLIILIGVGGYLTYPHIKERMQPKCDNCYSRKATGICANEPCSARLCDECFVDKGCPFCDSNRKIKLK